MQNILLDILILGLLVLLFGSIYRTQATPRLRYWIIGWLFVLAHFGIFLLNPVGDFWTNLVEASGIGTLMLGAVCFMFAASRFRLGPESAFLACQALSGPSLLYIFLTYFGFNNKPALLVLTLIMECGVLLVTRRLWSHLRNAFQASAICAAGGAAWIIYTVLHGQADVGAYAILTQFYLMNAILYWKDFRRFSIGVLTAVSGLVAWAAVFPCSLSLAVFFPHLTVSPELWNLPKYFVEFGMILTLLEDEIITASQQREGYRVLFDGNPHPMWIFDSHTLAFLRVNDAALSHYGYSQREFLNMTLRDIRPAGEVFDFESTIKNMTPPMLVSGPWTHIRKDGSRIQVEVATHSINFEGRQALFSLVQDVTERQQLHDRLLHQAHHDTLTGLPNRLLLKDRMEQALAAADRHGHKAAVICLDLDRFKQINDTYGHHIGDLSLQQLAERLRSRLRAVDTIARSGGEEFTIVIGNLASCEDAERVAEDLIDGFRQAFAIEGYNLDLSASIGVALYPDNGTDADQLWRSADAAMYRAKHSGGNQFVFVSNEISNLAIEANEIEVTMRRALKEGGFELQYQPQYTIGGRLCGLEALLRLHHPKMGTIPPDRFIPIAEESGLIVPIGSWVLEEVCRQSIEWQKQGLLPVRIALNVSPLQFMRTDFSTQVRDVLSTYKIDPSFLEIEMTETTVMRNLEEIARQMRDLAGLGVQFSVDDFGTGYSSLRHLHQLPITTLKIDRSFIERICDPNGTYSIVQAILSLAHSLDMQVVAEGVEREDQVAMLRSLNCDLLQGYLWGRPQPAEFIPHLILSGTVESYYQPDWHGTPAPRS